MAEQINWLGWPALRAERYVHVTPHTGTDEPRLTREEFIAELRAVAVCPCTDPDCTRREAIEMAAKVLEGRR